MPIGAAAVQRIAQSARVAFMSLTLVIPEQGRASSIWKLHVIVRWFVCCLHHYLFQMTYSLLLVAASSFDISDGFPDSPTDI